MDYGDTSNFCYNGQEWKQPIFVICYILILYSFILTSVEYALREKCQNTEFFLVRIFLYLVQMQENVDQKKLRIWTLFTRYMWHNG